MPEGLQTATGGGAGVGLQVGSVQAGFRPSTARPAGPLAEWIWQAAVLGAKVEAGAFPLEARIEDGRVYLRGQIKVKAGVSLEAADTAFTLPEGCRPASAKAGAESITTTTAEKGLLRGVTISAATGLVKTILNVAETIEISLDGFNFDLG